MHDDQIVDPEAAIAPAAGNTHTQTSNQSWYLVPRSSWKGDVERIELRQEMTQLLASTNAIEIQLAPGEVKFYSGDISRILYLGREHMRDDRLGRRLKTRAFVADQQLDIVSVWPDGMRVTESYTLLPGGKELLATLKWESKHLVKPFELARRYTHTQP